MEIVYVKKTIRTDKHGLIRPGKVVALHPSVAKAYLEQGAVERYETKVAISRPFEPALQEEPSSASQAGQASPQKTPKKSGSGGKKATKDPAGEA